MAGVSNLKIKRSIFIVMFIALFAVSSTKGQDGRPIADAGLSRYAGPDPIVLDGTGSYDPDESGELSYSWQQISGPTVIISDANTATPTVSDFVQTEEIQICEFELIVSVGELSSLPDTVKVIVVANFGDNVLRLANDSFDSNKPTYIWFAGGDCIVRIPYEEPFPSIWLSKANMIHFPYYEPDPNYIPGDVDAPRTYYRCGDMIIAYLSSAAPDYHQPIQSGGWSTGGQPAIDVGIHLNLTYADTRYAVNRVTLIDARACRDFSDSINQFLDSSVDGEQCWIDNHRGSTDGPFPSWPSFYPNVLRIGSSLSHMGVQTWYINSLTNSDMNQFNHGVIGGAYWSVVGPGKNLQLASTPSVETYSFKWVGGVSSGYMDFWDETNHPGRLPKPVTLVGPENGAIVDVGGAVFSCEESENAVGYQLLFGPDPYRVMDYLLISDTPGPPVRTISEFPFEQTWWTVKVYDSFGSTIYADPCCINAAVVSPPDSFPAYTKYSGGTGEPNDPYQIATAEDLMLLGETTEDYDKHFILTADIDLDPNLPGRQVFSRAVIHFFKGVFDGNDHTISHLTISGDRELGLFGNTGSGAKISNLGLEVVDVSGTGNSVGGLVGHNDGCIITSYSTGAVTGNESVGGLVGANHSSLTSSYSTGTVSGNTKVGGLVGSLGGFGSYGILANCYSTSAVTGDWDVGGLVGYIFGSITTSYSTGAVTGNESVGGLVGRGFPASSITSSFWDIETSGLAGSHGGIGLTTAEMQTATTFLRAGWDFVDETENGTDDLWGICEGTNYPKLVWQISPADFVCPDGITLDDFDFFMDNWEDVNCDLSNGYCDGTDLDLSGTVDINDFAILLDYWLAEAQ
jgi:hypothetical protein